MKALILNEEAKVSIKQIEPEELPNEEISLKVEYSALN